MAHDTPPTKPIRRQRQRTKVWQMWALVSEDGFISDIDEKKRFIAIKPWRYIRVTVTEARRTKGSQ